MLHQGIGKRIYMYDFIADKIGQVSKYFSKKGFSKDQALNLKMIRDLQPGDFVTHIDHGVGKFSGLQKKKSDLSII